MNVSQRDIIISFAIIFICCIINHIIQTKKNMLFNIGILCLTIVMSMIYSLTGVSPISGFSTNIRFDNIQLIPFYTIKIMLHDGITLYTFTNIIGNIAMFVPVGFLIPLLLKSMEKWYKVIFLGCISSLVIELCQLFLVRGTDIDDLILNTSGVLFGYIFYKIIKNIIPSICEAFKYKQENKCKWLVVCAIVIPLVICILFGFYDRNIYLSM